MRDATGLVTDETGIDKILADSFPASDPPPWTLGVDRAEPARDSRSAAQANNMANRDIFITEEDYEKLGRVLDGARLRNPRDREHVEQLATELNRAHVVSPDEIPADVVTMNSEVALKDLDTGEEMVLTVVFPAEARSEARKVSVLAPLGTAVLGFRAGDVIEWQVPGGTRRLQVGRVLYQPEAALRSGGP